MSWTGRASRSAQSTASTKGSGKLYINPTECIDCGACEPVCPVEAISQDRRVPDGDSEFIEDDRQFFVIALPGRDEPIGSPGGASGIGPVGIDTTLVAQRRPS